MSNSIKQITEEALALSYTERAELADRLVESLQTSEPEFELLWSEEAAKRLRDIRLGQAESIQGEEALQKIRSVFVR